MAVLVVLLGGMFLPFKKLLNVFSFEIRGVFVKAKFFCLVFLVFLAGCREDFSSQDYSGFKVVGDVYEVRVCNEKKIQGDFVMLHTIGGHTLYWFKGCKLAHAAELPGAVFFARQEPDEMLGVINRRTRGVSDQMAVSYGPDGSELFDSRKVRRKIKMHAHHDMIKTSRGTYMAIMQRVVGPKNSRDDVIVEFNRAGDVLWELSMNRLMFGKENGAQNMAWGENWLHTNSIDIFPDGDLLVSARNLNEIVKVRYPEGSVVWRAGKEVLGFQHHASIAKDGRVLVFNNGVDLSDFEKSESGVAAFDSDGQFLWEKKLGFFSDGYGSVQVLENGNWLVVDGKGGRVIEYSSDFSETLFDLQWRRENHLWWASNADRSTNSIYRAQSVKAPFFVE